MSKNYDLWTVWISNSPECDKRYGSGGFLALLLAIVDVLTGLAQYFRH